MVVLAVPVIIGSDFCLPGAQSGPLGAGRGVLEYVYVYVRTQYILYTCYLTVRVDNTGTRVQVVNENSSTYSMFFQRNN